MLGGGGGGHTSDEKKKSSKSQIQKREIVKDKQLQGEEKETRAASLTTSKHSNKTDISSGERMCV